MNNRRVDGGHGGTNLPQELDVVCLGGGVVREAIAAGARLRVLSLYTTSSVSLPAVATFMSAGNTADQAGVWDGIRNRLVTAA